MTGANLSSALRCSVLFGAAVSTTAAAQADPAPVRVVVFDIEAHGGSGADVAQLPDLISQIISTHRGYEVVPVAELHGAIRERQKPGRHCSTEKACLSAVARDTNAQFILTSSYTQKNDGYALELVGFDPKLTASPERALEESGERANLPRSARLCLDRIFKWRPLPASVPDAPPIARLPSPPPAVNRQPSVPSGSLDTRPVLALLSVKAGAGFDWGDTDSIESLLLSALEETRRFRLIGRTDIQTLLDLEAKKQAAGCSEGDDCMVAVAGALGADYVASANVGKLGHTTVLAFRVIKVRTATVLIHTKQTVQAKDDLVHAVDLIAQQTAAALASSSDVAPSAALKNALVPAPTSPPSAWHPVGIAAAVIGGVVLATATGLGVGANLQAGSAHTDRATSPVLSRVNTVNGMAQGANVGWAVGGVLSAAGITLVVLF